MGKCRECGRKGLLLKVGKDGLCSNCRLEQQHNAPHVHAYYGDYEASFTKEGKHMPATEAALHPPAMDRYALYLRKSRQDIEGEKLGEEETLARHRRILTNPTYKSKVRWNDRMRVTSMVDGELVSSRPRSNHTEHYTEYDGKHAALVDEEAFAAASARFHHDRTKASCKTRWPACWSAGTAERSCATSATSISPAWSRAITTRRASFAR